MSDPLVVLEKVNKHFGDLHVLRDIDLTVDRGEVVVVIGPSGSGKSTLCRCINRLEPIDSGRIEIDGVPLPEEGKALARLRADVGMVFQSFNLFAHKTVLQNVTLGPVKVRRTPKAEAETRSRELLERVGVASQADKYPAQLSGGQQQRVAIARALACSRAIAGDSFRTLIGPRVTFSMIVLWAKRLNDWNTMPTSARSLASALPSSGSGTPSMVIVPSWIGSRRLMARHRVDLPEPDGPMTTTTSPRSTDRSMSLRTCSAPNHLLTWSSTTRGSTVISFGP